MLVIYQHSLFKIKEKKLKIHILRAVLIFLIFCSFAIIFGFSNQDGEKSGRISRKVTEMVIKFFSEELQNNQKLEVRIHKIVRKIAHFSIYSLVGFLILGLLKTYELKEKTRVFMSILFGFIYASTDEIHQLFIPGRARTNY